MVHLHVQSEVDLVPSIEGRGTVQHAPGAVEIEIQSAKTATACGVLLRRMRAIHRDVGLWPRGFESHLPTRRGIL